MKSDFFCRVGYRHYNFFTNNFFYKHYALFVIFAVIYVFTETINFKSIIFNC